MELFEVLRVWNHDRVRWNQWCIVCSWQPIHVNSNKHELIPVVKVGIHLKSPALVEFSRESELTNTSKHTLKTDVAEKAPDKSTLQLKLKFNLTYCIFEDVRGHGSAFCFSHEFDYEQNLQKAKAHKVCLVCLIVANNKEKDCPNKVKNCMLCGQLHNVHLHARKDVVEAFKKKKAEGETD